MSELFTSFRLKDVTLRNRIAVPPMCQYRAADGLVNDWHHVHYAGLSRGGAGLVIVEATAVAPEGRISPGCLGLWNDQQAQGLENIAAVIQAGGAVPGIQIAHAGRKASAYIAWEGGSHIPEDDPQSWQPIGPSPIAYGNKLPRVPTAMNVDDIARVRQNFVDSAVRARDAGFQWLELHFAHGYLAQSFASTHSNHRDDQYGGDLSGRGRFLLETLSDVRQHWPENLPLTIRFGVIEYDGRDEQTLVESIQLARQFSDAGMDMMNVSLRGNIPDANVPSEPGFLVPIASRVKQEANIPVATAWGIGEPSLAERSVADGHIDLVMVGRAHLANPHWPYAAAKELKIDRPSWVLPAAYAHWLD